MPEPRDADAQLLEEIKERQQSAADHRKPYEDRWDRFYRQYVLYNDFKSAWRDTPDRDRKGLLYDARREWGANLKTPWAFATVETLVPRMVAHRPRMLVLPRRKLLTPGVDVDKNADNMRFLIDAQQEQIGYELKLQSTVKTGLIYGLGVQKSGWRYEECVYRQLRKKVFGKGWVPDKARVAVEFDDPDVDNLDIWDFFWDPYAATPATMEWAIHRAWRSTRYVLDKLARSWKYEAAPTEEELAGKGAAQRYSEARQARMDAEGVGSGWQPRDEDIHEVWEYHDGKEVVTVLDQQWIVQRGNNPYWHGDLPFYGFRPSERPGQFVGTGAIEPIEHLIAEMDTLRSQMRDNATIALNKPFFYNDGLLDPDDVIFGPGVGIPVNGPPGEVIEQARVQDIPNSSYQDSELLKGDIERASGLSDQVMGVAGPMQTATGAQIVQQNVAERVKLMIRRAELELIAPCARHFGRMNQQKIRDTRDVRIPQPPEEGQPDRRWAWVQLTPDELLGEFAYVPEGGSTEPENVAQMRQDFQMAGQLQSPEIDQREWLIYRMKLLGVDQPERFLTEDSKISTKVLDVLKQRLVGGPDEDDAQIVMRDPEQPDMPAREMHPLEVDEFIESIVQEVEAMEQQAEQAQQGGQQGGQVPPEEMAA